MKHLLCAALALVAAWDGWTAPVNTAPQFTEPFDYFQNSWNVIGLDVGCYESDGAGQFF